jgi:hypothetical protein
VASSEIAQGRDDVGFMEAGAGAESMRLVYAVRTQSRRSGKCAMGDGPAVPCVRRYVQHACTVARECAAAFRGHACDDLLGGARGRDATLRPPGRRLVDCSSA